MEKVLFNWSGGKDSSLCLYKLLQSKQYEIACLLTTLNKEKGRISMHGVREALLEQQAERLELPLHKVQLPDQVSMKQYDELMNASLKKIHQMGIHHAVFGDIFLEDLRSYREQRLKKAGFGAMFPLWQQSTQLLVNEFIDLGFKAVVVCVDESKLDRSFVGREYNHQFLSDLPSSVDPCGEHGEFHTFVYDGPIFSKAVSFEKDEIVRKRYPQKTSGEDDFYQSHSV